MLMIITNVTGILILPEKTKKAAQLRNGPVNPILAAGKARLIFLFPWQLIHSPADLIAKISSTFSIHSEMHTDRNA